MNGRGDSNSQTKRDQRSGGFVTKREQSAGSTVKFVRRDDALAAAGRIAGRNSELMRRLA